MTRSKTKAITALCTLAVLCQLGCGGDSASISGSVTYDGKPVTRGVISIAPADGRGKGEGAKILNGKYAIELGVHTVNFDLNPPKKEK
jgi:hypothetical protein